MTVAQLGDSVQKLQQRLTGHTLLPTDDAYDETRRGFNLGIDQHPALIVVVENPQDVVSAVRFARDQHLGVSILLTGHGIQYPADDNMLIVTSAMKAVHVDVSARTARIEAGVRFQELLDQTVKYGLAPLMGTSPHVGIIGYTLGGGIGWLSRKYGFAADSVRWLDVVTADGVLRRASPDENADLFWALRGGGSNFGVVTEMEFNLYTVETIYGGSLMYPPESARDALRFFRDWSRELPDEMMASIALMKFPNIPQLPEAIRGKSQVLLRAAYDGSSQMGQLFIQRWLDWQKPLNNTFKQMPFSEIASIQNDPTDPASSYASNELFDDLSDAAIDVIAQYAFDKDSPILYNEFRTGGGALARGEATTSAVGNREARFYFLIGGITPNAQVSKVVESYAQHYKDALKPYHQGGAYLNFMRGEEAATRALDAYGAEGYKRLVALKAQYDPTNMFRYSYQVAAPNPTNA